ncbi:unnamed protein product, partial [marine sediment metagenome]
LFAAVVVWRMGNEIVANEEFRGVAFRECADNPEDIG